MTRKMREGSVTLEAPHEESHQLAEPPGEGFDWVDFRCRCPSCGAAVDGFRTKDFCHQFDTVDYRTAYHFYATCECGLWIDFIRRNARSIEEFEIRSEPM
ncbi:MAG: hypothetical protein JW741_24100 [Sedimentisphaerales bacterium]|nr:hypothetical protein [Sedimentisphaerales bacterium]